MTKHEESRKKLKLEAGAYVKVLRPNMGYSGETKHLVGTVVRVKSTMNGYANYLDVKGLDHITWDRDAFEVVTVPAANLARNRDPDREVQTFETGATVRVVCKPDRAPSWNATYMDHLVYRQGVVEGLCGPSGLVNVKIEGEDRAWSFPSNSLMLIMSADGDQASNGSASAPSVQQRGATAGKDGEDMAKEQRVLRCRSFDGTKLGDKDVYFSALQSWLEYPRYDDWIRADDNKHEPSSCWYVVEILPYNDSFALLREVYGIGNVLEGLGDKADAARAAVALAKVGDCGKPSDFQWPSALPSAEVHVTETAGLKEAMFYGTFEPERYDKDTVARRKPVASDRLYDYQRTLASAVAKLVGTKNLRPSILNNIPRSTTSKESTMGIEIKNVTFVNGTPVKDLSQDSIVDIITRAENELAGYNKVTTKTRALKAKIATLEKGIADLVAISDERYAKDNPGEATADA